MEQRDPFTARTSAAIHRLSSAEQAVVRFFQENREEVLVGSAASLAAKIGTSDATVIRATQALGYSGLDELRRDIADELRKRNVGFVLRRFPEHSLRRFCEQVRPALVVGDENPMREPASVRGWKAWAQ